MYNPQEDKIYSASTRLFDAWARLERNLQSVTVGQDRGQREQQALLNYQRENEELRENIARLEQQYQELQVVAGKVNGKLESTLERLGQILEK